LPDKGALKMIRTIFPALTLLLMLNLAACSGNSGTPVAPDPLFNRPTASSTASTQLWGVWDIIIDVENMEVEGIPNRQGMFTTNIVNILNAKPTALQFSINDTPIGMDYVDIDIDVGITHPFPGLPQYNGYDVRGIFMGNGSAALATGGLNYPVLGTDQIMLPDPDDDIGGPDGYTRWYNASEFTGPGMPLFMYTKGNLASPGYTGTATLCPYKYFADSLGTDSDLFTFLNANPNLHGVFSSGATNERNYYLRFPFAGPGVKFSYAVIANWIDPDTHPANASEAVACDADDSQSGVFYVDPGNSGGEIVLDFSLWNWSVNPSTITVESTVLSAPYTLSGSEMVPVGGNENYSTWHVEIPADDVKYLYGNEYWIIAEYANVDYSNPYGIPNDAENDPLTAYFRNDLYVYPDHWPDPVCDVQVVTEMPAQNWGTIDVEFDASGSYDPDGQPLEYEWDFDNDGDFGDSYNSGTDSNPIKTYSESNQTQVCLRVTNYVGLYTECCVDVDIQVLSAKNIPLRTDAMAADLAVDPNDGNVLILYEDGQVWEYTESGLFTQGNATYLFTANIPTSPYNPTPRIADYRIDIAPNGNMMCAGEAGSPGWPAGVWGPTGTKLDAAPGPGAGDSVPDVISWKPGGSFTDSHTFLCPGNGGAQNNMYTCWYGTWSWQQHYQPDPPNDNENAPTGIPNVKFNQVVGVEPEDGQNFWCLEDTPDYYCAKRLLSGWYHTYNGAYFGTGAQTEADDGWYEAKDLTMDSTAHFYVLDKLSSGQGRIKPFTSGAPGTALTDNAAGDPDSISESPLRIEGSTYISPTYGNMVFVLHGDGIPCKLSVFFMSDFNF